MKTAYQLPLHPPSNGHSADGWPWIPDQGDGTYRNPVLFADYSDADVIRVGEDFYLTASSFNCTPGLPILHSTDLVNWTIINHALKNLPHPRYSEVQHGQGVWAPSIRHHDGKFWIIFPTPDEGIFVTTAADPAGEWTQPHLLLGGKGLIDPCPLWDDDGKAYLIFAYAGSRAGIRNKLHVVPMTPDATKTTGKGQIVAEIDPLLPALEGPKLHKRNGWYYISAPSGGVETGWQTVFRANHIYGPFEEKIVLAQCGTAINGPHQGALVDTADGEWWFLHFQDRDFYGRIVHLQPVRWENDWPMVGEAHDHNGVGSPVPHHRKPAVGRQTLLAIPQTSDDFDGKKLGLQWQWHANQHDGWYSLSARLGHLQLRPQFVLNGDLSKAPNLLLQKFPAAEFTVETRLELPSGHPDLHAGLAVIGLEYAALDVQCGADGYRLRLSISGDERASHLVENSSVTLQVKVGAGGVCRFGIVSGSTGFYQLGPAFRARPGRWIGAKIGVYCLTTNVLDISGHADIGYFHFGPPNGVNPDGKLHLASQVNGNPAHRPNHEMHELAELQLVNP